MEQAQASIEEMKAQMAAQMEEQTNRFMEVLASVTKGQEDLRALIEKTREEQRQGGLLSENYSAGQFLQDLVDNHDEEAHVPPRPPPQPNFITRNIPHRVIKKENPFLEPGYNDYVYSLHPSDVIIEKDDRKLQSLEERLKAIEGQGALGMDLTDLGLVPGVRIPHKFKVPTFEKYTGLTCPKTHVKSYYRKMAAYFDDEKLLMHFFQDSLAGASLDWYMQLERTHVRNWRDLVDAFLRHYQYNIDMAPSRAQLQSLSQGANESFKEYAQKWRELAARVQPPMPEKEMIDMFMGTLQGAFYDRMVGTTTTGFSDLVMAGERIEAGLKLGKIQASVSSSSSGTTVKKLFGGYVKKKEGETSAIYRSRPQFSRPPQQNNYPQQSNIQRRYQQVNAVAIPVTQPHRPPQQQQFQQQNYRQQQPQQQNYQQQKRNFNQTRPRVFDPIPMPYSQLLQHLLQLKLVTLRNLPPTPDKLPANYNANARCEFHSGGVGHDVENCMALKYKVQDLIDSKAIQFTPDNGPNVLQNPMPPHSGPSVNVVEVEQKQNRVKDVEMLKTPLLSVKKALVRNSVFPGCYYSCEACQSSVDGCIDLKEGIQKLLDKGRLQCEKVEKAVEGEVAIISIPYVPVNIPVPTKPAPLTITVPGPVPYTSEKAIPWHYGSEVFYHGVKKDEGVNDSLNVESFTGVGKLTRRGRIYASLDAQKKADELAKTRGKQVQTGRQDPETTEEVRPEVNQEVEELLKIIKKSDYKVVDHLSQTPSKISILSLLLCSETHRNALMKLLSTAFVPQEISVNQLEGVISSISAKNGLGFTNTDLPREGVNHNKALHISIECKGTTLSHVLVDTGSSLNVLPKSALMKIDYAGVEIRPSDLIVKAFDGSKRSVFGEVDLPVKIGPQTFMITFYVMDIHPAYCCLLGRPWIHGAGAVTSTLHQKLKYLAGGKIVTVCGEEEYMVSQLSSYKYVEMEGEVHETPCQAFEAVQVVNIPQKKQVVTMTSLKDAKAVVEAGHPDGWGRVLDLPPKFNKMGLGYDGYQPKEDGKNKKVIQFRSAGFEEINMVGEEFGKDNFDKWIRPTEETSQNWTIEDSSLVTFAQE